MLWKLRRNKADKPHNEDVGKSYRSQAKDRIEISKQQYGFMPGKETTNAMLALKRKLTTKFREKCCGTV